MSDIQRWFADNGELVKFEDANGILTWRTVVVTYADHVASVAAEAAAWRVKWMRDIEACRKHGYGQGQRDERERIVAALEAVYRYGRDRDPSAFELEVYEFIQTAIKGDN